MVALSADHLKAERVAMRDAHRFDVGQRLPPIDTGLAFAERVEVGAVQHENGRWHKGSGPIIERYL
jgi:hypothetical protein